MKAHFLSKEVMNTIASRTKSIFIKGQVLKQLQIKAGNLFSWIA